VIRDLAAADDLLSAQGDVCVIGGGIAGLIAASRLTAAGRRVIVLESGDQRPQPEIDALNRVEQAGAAYATAVSGRVRALGGASNAWGGRMLPMTAHDMGARDYIGLGAWPIDKAALDRFTPDIEALFGLDHSAYDELPSSPLPDDHPDMAARWTKWPTFRRRNVAHLLRDAIALKPSLEIWLNATACGFVVDAGQGRLRGVEARSLNGKRLIAMAEGFILAAGTLETVRLLLMLDRQTNGRAFAGSDALGRYFHDHLKLEVAALRPIDRRRTNRVFGYRFDGLTRRSLHLETTAAAQREDRAASGYAVVRHEFPPDTIHHYARSLGQAAQGRRWPEPPSAGVVRDLQSLGPALYWWVGRKQMHFGPRVEMFLEARVEQAPIASSRLMLGDARDALGAPMLLIDWRKTAADDRAFRWLLKRTRSFWLTTFLNAACPIAWSIDPDGDGLSDRAVDTRHPAGGARMGVDPRTSVVSPTLACHAVLNLIVASAAVFPSSGSANPTLTVMQLACRAAEGVAAYLARR
jgi:choline dehydrogenase-like flavoprotein